MCSIVKIKQKEKKKKVCSLLVSSLDSNDDDDDKIRGRQREKWWKERENLAFDKFQFKWMISIWTISSSSSMTMNLWKTILDLHIRYLIAYSYLSCCHRLDHQTLNDDRNIEQEKSSFVVSLRTIRYQIMKVTFYWTVFFCCWQDAQEHSSLHHQYLDVYASNKQLVELIIQWPLFKLDSLLMLMKRIQLFLSLCRTETSQLHWLDFKTNLFIRSIWKICHWSIHTTSDFDNRLSEWKFD